MSTGTRFGIQFPNGTYNRDHGFEAQLTEATVYPTREEAGAANLSLMDGEVVELPEATDAPDDKHWRGDPPTMAEVQAHAARDNCNVWAGMTQWMILQPTDQTWMVMVVNIQADNPEQYTTNIQYALDQGACAFRPLTIMGDVIPWPVLP